MLALPARLRSRRAALALCLVLVASGLAVAVLANQPGSRLPVAVGPASASTHTPSAGPTPAPTPADPPTPDTSSHLRLLHRSVAYTDHTAGHAGAPDLPAAGGILVDLDTNSIIWSKNPHVPLPPASTTKVVSSLVALENFDPSMTIEVTADALNQEYDETVMAIKAGQTYTVEELLDGMMMVSGNDAATAMAVDTVGLDRFVRAMNEQAAALGMTDSHFVTPVGLDDPGQRMSAYDLALVVDAAYASLPRFRDIVGRKEIDLAATDGHPDFQLRNLNRLLTIYPPALGVKPGYTGDAGYCFSAIAQRDGHRLLAVLLNENHIYNDSKTLFEWGFGQLGVPPLPTPTPVPTPTPRAPVTPRPVVTSPPHPVQATPVSH